MKRLSIILELRYGLPLFRKELKAKSGDDEKVRQILKDKRTHILATCMAAYPYTPTDELAKEFDISPKVISTLASMYGIKKSKELRSEINGENGKNSRIDNSRPVEKLDSKGRVVGTFDSETAAAKDIGVCMKSISKRCLGIHKSAIKGYFYRFKKKKPHPQPLSQGEGSE